MWDALGAEEGELMVCAVPLLIGVGVELDFFLLVTPATTPIMTAATTMTVIRATSRIQVDLRRPCVRCDGFSGILSSGCELTPCRPVST